MKSKRLLCGVLLAIVLSLTACGENSSTSTEKPDEVSKLAEEVAKSTESTNRAADKVVLTSTSISASMAFVKFETVDDDHVKITITDDDIQIEGMAEEDHDDFLKEFGEQLDFEGEINRTTIIKETAGQLLSKDAAGKGMVITIDSTDSGLETSAYSIGDPSIKTD